ncbi:zinc-ribbon domain containing protein [Methylobacter sp. sgz302048]|jgi:hypothetical protein|uniref:zinc-ribbon domain containing protein n=1 Tax=Methylobacter sp. sgz302048 TaxID=3455945 RepID=UPI003FA07496
MSVRIDKSKWSNSSRISSEYTGQFKNDDFYAESIGYRCHKCFQAFSFTPEEQKYAYEVDKKIIHYVPSLCPKCKATYEALSHQINNYQDTWNMNRDQMRSDRSFLEEWLRAVREKNSYGKRIDKDRERMLSKLLRELPYD